MVGSEKGVQESGWSGKRHLKFEIIFINFFLLLRNTFDFSAAALDEFYIFIYENSFHMFSRSTQNSSANRAQKCWKQFEANEVFPWKIKSAKQHVNELRKLQIHLGI